MRLQEFIDEFAKALKIQLDNDEKRWGDTWRHRSVEGQVDRVMAGFTNYADQFNHGNKPFPWLKVAGEALIGYVRETYPEYYLGEYLGEDDDTK